MFPKAALSLLVAVFALIPLKATWSASPEYQAELVQVKRVRSELRRELPSTSNLGSMHGLLGVQPQVCAVLARVLGVKPPRGPSFAAPTSRRAAIALAKHFGEDYVPAEFGYELARRWISYEKAHSSRPRKKNVELWNLECVGQFSEITRAAYIRDPLPRADFRIAKCWGYGARPLERCLTVLGPIENGFYKRFRRIIRKNKIQLVSFGSGGGSVNDALSMGRLIRRLKIETGLYSNCFSACALAFLGGRPRAISNPESGTLGFHQVSRGGRAVRRDAKIYQKIRRYVRAMGARPSEIIAFMMKASPAEMHYPDFTELCPSGAATEVRQMCQS